ncbi:MAG: DNA polymerase III subunit gamma/tau [Candidatus Paceibacterota bacterium]
MQALYRKYRPTIFEEVEGQEHIVRTLQGALLSGRIGHAYLFCGPRGTGKTTMARLLAKALNCTQRDEKKNAEPCHACSSCLEIHGNRSLDLIEIDAASNRGIDEIRNLKDSAIVAATSSKYKVFIIDEVHMLTPPAFNALLKILEEPPAHVIFILATTEPHKVLETILSRVQRFDFKKITDQKIVEKLKRIAKSEKVTVEEPALVSLASASSGSLRDAESAFSKLIAYTGDKITAEDAAEVLGIVPLQVHDDFLKLVQHKKTKEAIAKVSDLYESGVDLDNFLKQFVKYLRVSLMNAISQPQSLPEGQATVAVSGFDLNEAEFLIKAINLFVKAGNELKFSPVPQLPIELAILELTK